jgi:hypothetical protein
MQMCVCIYIEICLFHSYIPAHDVLVCIYHYPSVYKTRKVTRNMSMSICLMCILNMITNSIALHWWIKSLCLTIKNLILKLKHAALMDKTLGSDHQEPLPEMKTGCIDG